MNLIAAARPYDGVISRKDDRVAEITRTADDRKRLFHHLRISRRLLSILAFV